MQSIYTIALKNGKGLKIGTKEALGPFRKVKYFEDILRQQFCDKGFDHKVKIPQKYIFAVLLIQNINPTAVKTSKN